MTNCDNISKLDKTNIKYYGFSKTWLRTYTVKQYRFLNSKSFHEKFSNGGGGDLHYLKKLAKGLKLFTLLYFSLW